MMSDGMMSDGSLESGEFPIFIEEDGRITRDDSSIVGKPLAVAVTEDPGGGGGSPFGEDVSLGDFRYWG